MYGLDAEDLEVRTDIGRYHLAMYRAVVTGTYDGELTFVLRHAVCNENVCYNSDNTDPPASFWYCSGCTAPGNRLFTDFDLKTMSLVRMQQLLYVARRHSSKEEIFKLDFNNERGHGHLFSRPMTRNERTDYQLGIIENSIKAYVRNRRGP